MKNIVLISDLHSGDRTALCPPKSQLDLGGKYEWSYLQEVLWDWWNEFWASIEKHTKNDFYLINNGDSLEGDHHRTKGAISLNHNDQRRIAKTLLGPYVKMARAYYHVRGTGAHAGEMGEHEETLAEELGAVRHEKSGIFARPSLRKEFDGILFDVSHYIGVTGNMQYSTSAPMAEINRIFNVVARWGSDMPRVIARAHRHTSLNIPIDTQKGHLNFVITPCWKLKNMHLYGIAGGSTIMPEIGGVLIQVDGNDFQVLPFVKVIEQDEVEPDEEYRTRETIAKIDGEHVVGRNRKRVRTSK